MRLSANGLQPYGRVITRGGMNMGCAEMTAVERVATLLEGVEAGLIGPRDVGSIAEEMVELVRSLAAEPQGWTADLARILAGNIEPAARRAGGSEVHP